MQNHDNVIPIYRTGRLVTITVVSLVLADIAGAQQQDQSLSDNAHARLLAEGFLANYEAFPFYECKMRIRDGYCDTVQEAIRNGPMHDVAVARAMWLVDGEKVAYERKWEKRFEDTPPIIVSPGGEGIGVRAAPEGVLADEKMGLNVSFFALGATVNFRKTRDPLHFRGESTWNAGGLVDVGPRGTFGAFAVRQLKYGANLHIGDPTEIQGIPTTRVEFEYQGLSNIWFIDESRGFIPIETRSEHQGKVIQRAYITDIRKCSRSRWFPTRCIRFAVTVGNTRKYQVREFVVTALDVETRPDLSAFCLTLPAGMRINDAEKNDAQIKLGAEEVVHLSDLEDLYQRTQDMRLERQGLRPPRSSRWTLTLVLGLGAVIAIVAVSVFLYRRKPA